MAISKEAEQSGAEQELKPSAGESLSGAVPTGQSRLGLAPRYKSEHWESAAMAKKQGLWNAEIVRPAIIDSFRKLDPRIMIKNPVMFVVEVGSVVTSALLIQELIQHKPIGFDLQITLWLWFTVLFANFAEAIAEDRKSVV